MIQISESTEYRAGSIRFPKGKDGIVVSFSRPMLNAEYVVLVQQTNAGGYAPEGTCTYFNVLRKTKNSFQVQHKTSATDMPVKLTSSLILDWIAICHT